MKNNKKSNLLLGLALCIIAESIILFFCGRKYENGIINLALNNMARDGSKMWNEVDGKLYECSVTEVRKES